MLRIFQNRSVAGAKSYFSTADYYTEGHELQGVWRGEGAKRLGLQGTIDTRGWESLCDNLDPETGKTLTLRQRANRTVGYDFSFHVPKSLSYVYSLGGEDRILDAVVEAVNLTMKDIEAEMKTRVRKRGKCEDRVTGNMVWGEFVHFTARPVDGVPDPQVHIHCFVFNSTFDHEESAWKAGQFRDLKRDAPYFQAVFHSHLANAMVKMGYEIERSAKGWELKGIAKSTLDTFSRRTELIESVAKEKGIVDDAEKDGLGAKTREGKAKHLTKSQLFAEWRSRLSEKEWNSLQALVANARPIERNPVDPAVQAAWDYALEHCFERNSVVPERELLRTALVRGVGTLTEDQLRPMLAASEVIVGTVNGRRMATLPGVLAEEKRMLRFAREGRGSCSPLGRGFHAFDRDWLNADQKNAVNHVLQSQDRVMVIRGAAGSGKTSLMQEAVEAIGENGKGVFVFAPSADASRGVLREAGFGDAETVSRLLVDEKLQQSARGQVLWIDEAGLLGTRSMAKLFDLAERVDARVILSGDTRQHGSIERGAALRLLENEAGVIPAEVREIQRQKGRYKQAIKALSEGRTVEGFGVLNGLGWIREVAAEDRYQRLAADYLAFTKKSGTTALVVSPTHVEKDRVTHEIREGLQAAKKLSRDERNFTVLENAHLTQAERSDPVHYLPGDVLQFTQNATGHVRGQRIQVGTAPLPLDQAERFQLFRPCSLKLAAGDVIRITHNGRTLDDKHALNNGSLHKIKGFDEEGNIVLADNGWRIAKEFGHIDHGYAVTSYTAQGKTVDHVLIAQSSQSFPASSREQFYVSASRGRKSATIYTDDRAELLEAVNVTDDRMTATELAAEIARHRMRKLRELRDQSRESVAPKEVQVHREMQQ